MGLNLNIGSGQRRFGEGWLNVDCVSREGEIPDIEADARELPFPDESATCCVLHHVIEHFGCGEADGVIKECHRVLEPGGKLLVFVPDMRELARRLLAGRIDTYIFMVNAYGAYHGREEDRHRWGYTQSGLLEYLDGVAEWQRVKEKTAGPWPKGSDIAMDWWIAGGECVK